MHPLLGIPDKEYDKFSTTNDFNERRILKGAIVTITRKAYLATSTFSTPETHGEIADHLMSLNYTYSVIKKSFNNLSTQSIKLTLSIIIDECKKNIALIYKAQDRKYVVNSSTCEVTSRVENDLIKVQATRNGKLQYEITRPNKEGREISVKDISFKIF